MEWIIENPYWVSVIVMLLVAFDPTNKLSRIVSFLSPVFTKFAPFDKAQIKKMTRKQVVDMLGYFLDKSLNRDEKNKLRRKYGVTMKTPMNEIIEIHLDNLFSKIK